MRRIIFKRFIVTIALALILSGSIFGIVISNIITDITTQDMLYALNIVDYSLDYDASIKSQLESLKQIVNREYTRFTVMDIEGNVIEDSEVFDSSTMENHKDREEVKEAQEKGTGYARRKSNTLNIRMLYIAKMSENEKYILRIAVPFSGLDEYIPMLIPALLISIGTSLLISAFLASRFTNSISQPLYEIAEEMQKLKDENPEFNFKKYQYEEMNVIAETTKKMSDEVKESIKQIDFEKMVRQEFFSNASHELKTPITSVRGYVELLESSLVKDEEMKKDFLTRIKKEIQNMTNLINDILMISRLETKEVEVVLSEVRICPLLKEVCISLEPLAAECNVTLEMNCRPVTMYANTQQLRELFSNLINNAIKYNKPNGKVFIHITTEGKYIIIVVEDTGVGIPQDAQQRVFERFYRVDKGRSKKMGGTGLGLSIVKHVVNYYNGTLDLYSKLGEGTRITVRIPKNLQEK